MQPSQHSDFRIPTTKTMREYISVASSHPACGILLWPSSETNTGPVIWTQVPLQQIPKTLAVTLG